MISRPPPRRLHAAAHALCARGAALLVACVLTASRSGTAAAQAPPFTPQPEPPPFVPPPYAPPSYAWLDDEPPPPDQGARTHDGLYVRLALGLGWMSGSEDGPRVHDDIGYGGRGFSFELAIGGTPAPGLVVGSALAAARYGSLHRDDDGVSSRSAFWFHQLKSFADWYFDPHAGLHAQVGLGIGLMQGGVREPATDATGGVASLGLGYEWWIGEQWSAGLLAKVDGYALSRKQMPERVLAPGVLGTLTWH